MTDKSNHFADAAMMIRKPVAEIFEAFIDPAITTRFWFTKSSGKLEEGKEYVWKWEMYDVEVPVLVKSIIPNEKIHIGWGENYQEADVEWSFKALDADKTFVSIMVTGFNEEKEDLISQIRNNTGGFTWVLAGLKAYMEHGIELNLIADRFPQ